MRRSVGQFTGTRGLALVSVDISKTMGHRKTPSTAFESYDSAGYFGVCNFSVGAIVLEISTKMCADL